MREEKKPKQTDCCVKTGQKQKTEEFLSQFQTKAHIFFRQPNTSAFFVLLETCSDCNWDRICWGSLCSITYLLWWKIGISLNFHFFIPSTLSKKEGYDEWNDVHQVFFGYVLQVFCTKPQKVAYIFSMALNSYETKFDATTSFSSPINILMV